MPQWAVPLSFSVTCPPRQAHVCASTPHGPGQQQVKHQHSRAVLGLANQPFTLKNPGPAEPHKHAAWVQQREHPCPTPSPSWVQGNVILTDADYNILTLLRSHRDEDQGYAIQANRPYPIRTVRPFAPTTLESLQAALQGCDAKQTLKGAFWHALWDLTCLMDLEGHAPRTHAGNAAPQSSESRIVVSVGACHAAQLGKCCQQGGVR